MFSSVLQCFSLLVIVFTWHIMLTDLWECSLNSKSLVNFTVFVELFHIWYAISV